MTKRVEIIIRRWRISHLNRVRGSRNRAAIGFLVASNSAKSRPRNSRQVTSIKTRLASFRGWSVKLREQVSRPNNSLANLRRLLLALVGKPCRIPRSSLLGPFQSALEVPKWCILSLARNITSRWIRHLIALLRGLGSCPRLTLFRLQSRPTSTPRIQVVRGTFPRAQLHPDSSNRDPWRYTTNSWGNKMKISRRKTIIKSTKRG